MTQPGPIVAARSCIGSVACLRCAFVHFALKLQVLEALVLFPLKIDDFMLYPVIEELLFIDINLLRPELFAD